MSGESDKRELSKKPEVDDLTDYQATNSQGGAGVRTDADEAPASHGEKDEAAVIYKGGQETPVEYHGDYNDGADFLTVNNKGKTNA